MNDPRRLLEEETGLGRDLLRAAAGAPPVPTHLTERTIAAATRVATAAPAVGHAAARAALKLRFATLAKWTGGGLVVGATVVGVAVAIGNDRRPAPTVLMSPSRAAAPARPHVLRRRPTQAASPTASTEPPAPEQRDLPLPLPGEPAAASRGLGAEARLIDQASAALERGDAQAAMGLIEHYERSFPRGQLAPEASLLRLRALLRLGQSGRAAALAGELLRKEPNSRYARRVRALMGEEPSAGDQVPGHE